MLWKRGVQAPPVTYARTQLDMPDGGTVALDYEDFDKDLPYGLDRVRPCLAWRTVDCLSGSLGEG